MTREEAIKCIRGFMRDLTDGCQEALESVIPELAESEDERIRKVIYKLMLGMRKEIFTSQDEIVTKEKVLDYLEKQKEQKQEWSEEDEKDMAHITRILDDCYAYGKHDLSKTDHENLVNKLKSLRPSWKPSEVHLSALLAVFNDPDNIGSQTCQLALTDLYEQLKKL